MADWDADSRLLRDNLIALLRTVRDQADGRETLDARVALVWHRQIMDGLKVPDRRLVGVFRGPPDLPGYEVAVGDLPGVASVDVPAAVTAFEVTLSRVLEALDRRIDARTVPADADALTAVVEFTAWAHAEWVRIHPFANGNGRTARLWAAAIAMRYGLPPFVRLRPRPDDGYGDACVDAMLGDWRTTIPVFHRMLARSLAGG
ncbi:MAG: Fic family protein [Pseudomonadota bacterium]